MSDITQEYTLISLYLKSPLMKVKEESEKVGLKLNTKIMASGPITLMANRSGNNGNSDRLYLGGLQNH